MGGITSTGASQFANISGSAGSQTKKKDNVGRDEFLQLLITQLKNQDPEAPLDSKEAYIDRRTANQAVTER